MFEMDLPYDKKTLHLRLEDKNFAGVLIEIGRASCRERV